MQTILDEILNDEIDRFNKPKTKGSCDCKRCRSKKNNQELSDNEIIGTDTRKRIRSTNKAPFRYICQLDYSSSTIGYTGSGTLIGPRTILTAAHNVYESDVTLNPKNMVISPGRNGTSHPFGRTRASHFFVPRAYKNNPVAGSVNDYAIIRLKKSIGNNAGYWGYDHRSTSYDPVGTSILKGGLPLRAGVLKVNLSGYPGDKPNGCATTYTAACGTLQYWTFNRTNQLRNGILHYLNDTFRGHSGSPVWVKRHSSNGGRVLVGIHVARDDDFGTKANRAVFINGTIRAFIRRHLR